MSRIPKAPMDLKQFMLRSEVLKLYREIFRIIKLVPDKNSQKELRQWTRHDFRSNMHHTDELTIKMMLQQGRRSLTELQNSLELAGLVNNKTEPKQQ